MAEEKQIERRDGPTPAGGSYSEALCDDEGRLVEIVEYDESGVPVARTYTADERMRIVAERGEGALPDRRDRRAAASRSGALGAGRAGLRSRDGLGRPPLLVGTLISGGYWTEWESGPTDEIIFDGFRAALLRD